MDACLLHAPAIQAVDQAAQLPEVAAVEVKD
jgi:hypothetical protein